MSGGLRGSPRPRTSPRRLRLPRRKIRARPHLQRIPGQSCSSIERKTHRHRRPPRKPLRRSRRLPGSLLTPLPLWPPKGTLPSSAPPTTANPTASALTRKPFVDPLWRNRSQASRALIDGNSRSKPATARLLIEDYCHAIEHSIEFQNRLPGNIFMDRTSASFRSSAAPTPTASTTAARRSRTIMSIRHASGTLGEHLLPAKAIAFCGSWVSTWHTKGWPLTATLFPAQQ